MTGPVLLRVQYDKPARARPRFSKQLSCSQVGLLEWGLVVRMHGQKNGVLEQSAVTDGYKVATREIGAEA